MSTPSLALDQGERVASKRLLWVGPLTIVVAVIVNLIIRAIAVSLLGIGADFPPLSAGPPVVFTIMGVLGAVVVFAIIARFAKRPIRLFRIVAVVVLVLSLIPDLLLLSSGAMPGTSLAAILTLMLMHVAAGVVSVWLLTTQTLEQ